MREVIYSTHLFPTLDECMSYVRADKAGNAGDQIFSHCVNAPAAVPGKRSVLPPRLQHDQTPYVFQAAAAQGQHRSASAWGEQQMPRNRSLLVVCGEVGDDVLLGSSTR